MLKQFCFTLLLIVITFFIAGNTLAQSGKIFAAKNTSYAEAATQGPAYSINYDRIFSEGNVFAKSYRIGFSIYKNVFALPIGINFITGKSQHHAELSFTAVPYIEKVSKLFSPGNLSDKKMYIISGAGYRYQKPSGGFYFKASAGPVLYLDPPSDNFWNMDPKVFAGVSVGAGYSF
jgi:hypothetical protein